MVCWSELVKDGSSGLKGEGNNRSLATSAFPPIKYTWKTFSKAMEALGLNVSLGMGKVAIHSAGHVFLIPNQESQRLRCR